MTRTRPASKDEIIAAARSAPRTIGDFPGGPAALRRMIANSKAVTRTALQRFAAQQRTDAAWSGVKQRDVRRH